MWKPRYKSGCNLLNKKACCQPPFSLWPESTARPKFPLRSLGPGFDPEITPKKWYFWIIYLKILYFLFYFFFSFVNLASIIARKVYAHSYIVSACLRRFMDSHLNATSLLMMPETGIFSLMMYWRHFAQHLHPFCFFFQDYNDVLWQTL